MADPIVMPRLGDFMTEGIVAKWTKSSGESVGQGEVIAEIESEKLNYELEAASAGILHTVAAEGATVLVDGLLGYVLAEGESPPEAPAIQAAATVAAPAPRAATARATARPPGDVVASTPGARRLAAKLDVDISKVTPSGPRGRVVDADVRVYAEQQAEAQRPSLPPGLPEPSKILPVEGMRKAIADHMRESISSTAQLSFFIEVDVTEAERLRREVSKQGATALSKTHVFIKASAEALKRSPALNTVMHAGNVLYFDDVNVGIAVALDDGLIVPVLRGVQDKTIVQVAEETTELVTRATEGKLLPDDVFGGTFTISVLGTVDGFTPILNRGQSAILGVGRTVQKAVVRRGEIVPRSMITVSLTVDHQVVDGEVAAGFLRRLQQTIERPASLFR